MSVEPDICIENLDALIEYHLPYVIRTISSVTGKYVSVEHDEEFVVALEALTEAVQRYDSKRGAFLNYAGLVIRSRLLTYLQEEKADANTDSLDQLAEQGYEAVDPHTQENDLHDEIQAYQQELEKFGLSLDAMVEYSPRHRNTRETAVLVAEQASREKKIVDDTYRKHKLPIRPIAALCNVTEKIQQALYSGNNVNICSEIIQSDFLD